MTKCQVCDAKSGLFLCNNHIRDLSEKLTALVHGAMWTETVTGDSGRTASGGGWCVEYLRERRMPGLLEYLADSAIGQVRRGDTGRRAPREDTHLQGERSLASHIEAFPNDDETSLAKARRQRATAAMNHALAAGGVNGRASHLLATTRRKVREWNDLCTMATGVHCTPLDPSDLSGTVMWLAQNVNKLAGIDSAGQLYHDVSKAVERIERCINPPIPQRVCGPCPTVTGEGGAQCGRELVARRDDIEITCPACKETHNVESLMLRLVNQTYYLTFTVPELLRLLPLGQVRVPSSTLYDWINKGKLQPRGFNPDGIPMYLMADVRSLEAARKAKTKARVSK